MVNNQESPQIFPRVENLVFSKFWSDFVRRNIKISKSNFNGSLFQFHFFKRISFWRWRESRTMDLEIFFFNFLLRPEWFPGAVCTWPNWNGASTRTGRSRPNASGNWPSSKSKRRTFDFKRKKDIERFRPVELEITLESLPFLDDSTSNISANWLDSTWKAPAWIIQVHRVKCIASWICFSFLQFIAARKLRTRWRNHYGDGGDLNLSLTTFGGLGDADVDGGAGGGGGGGGGGALAGARESGQRLRAIGARWRDNTVKTKKNTSK